MRSIFVVAVLLVLAAGTAGWVVFVPRWPTPGGPYAVGRSDVHLRDSQGRTIAATVWYPAARHGKAGAAASSPLEAGPRAPLILYSPGWGGSREQSSVQTANLASHGFVVVACDDQASRRDADLDLSSDAAMAATEERAGRDVVAQAERLLAVLNALGTDQIPLLAGRLDLARVGILGYSLGGAAGLQAALLDARIAAVFSVDGGLFGPPAEQIGKEAYFLLSSREAFPSPSELASPNPFTRNYARISAQDLPRNARRMERPDNYWAAIDRASHEDLSDQLFVLSRHKLFRTNRERLSIAAAIGALEVAFFRSLLLGEPAPLGDLRGRDRQDVRWISSTSAAPGAAKAQQ